jgi:hypothetical protein
MVAGDDKDKPNILIRDHLAGMDFRTTPISTFDHMNNAIVRRGTCENRYFVDQCETMFSTFSKVFWNRFFCK